MLLQTCLAATTGGPGGFAVAGVPYIAVDPAAGNSLAAVSVHIVPAIPAFLLLLASLLLLNFLSVAGIPAVAGMPVVGGMLTIVVVYTDVSSCCRLCRCRRLVLAVDPALVDVHTSLGVLIFWRLRCCLSAESRLLHTTLL